MEHFYYGQVLYEGKPQGELRLLAKSAGIKADHFSEVISVLRLPPAVADPTLAVALLRGKSIPHIFVQSQMGEAGGVLCHYYLPPLEMVRQLGGNIRRLLGLLEPSMPQFTRTDATLPPVEFDKTDPPTVEQQQEAMLALLGATNDRFDVIEALLAAVIIGVPVVIKGAPTDLNARIGMIEGLLALLPHPARVSVTFATHVTPTSFANAQIRFVTSDTPDPSDALIYTWGGKKTDGVKPENDYARYIRSQLRLDTELVVDKTTLLTPIAGWRLRRGEPLSEALTYASFRLTMDEAVSNGLPVEAAEVARVLSVDPTLSEEQQTAYVRHLLALVMATDDVEDADLVVSAAGKPPLEPIILAQITDMLNNGKALRVYRAVTRWLTNPAGFKGMYWIDLAQKAALAYAQAMVRSRDSKSMNLFLAQVRENASAFEAKYIVSRLLEIALPLAASDPVLAQTSVLLAATTLPLDSWQRFINLKPILAQLPRALGRLIAYLNADANITLAPGLMAQAASEFGSSWRSLMLARLSEVALAVGRMDVFDAPTLSALAYAAGTTYGDMYDSVMRRVVYHFGEDAALKALGEDAAKALLEILLARGAYADLAAELGRQGRILYPSGRQVEFAAMVRTLFASTPILIGSVPECVAALSAEGTKPLPLIMAHFGVLEQHQWSPQLRDVAGQLVSHLGAHRLILEGLPTDLMLELLGALSAARDLPNTIRAAVLIPMNTARRGDEGIPAMLHMYRVLTWEPNVEGAAEVQKAALENLRRFVRWSSEGSARNLINQVARVDEGLIESLKATYVIRRMLGGENIADYAYALNTAANFLQDTGAAYTDRQRLPLHNVIVGDLDSLNGGVSDLERKQLADALIDLIKLASGLATQHRVAHIKETEAEIQALLDGTGEAHSVIDMFRVMSGYFGRGRRVVPKMERLMDNHPLGDRTAPALLRELQTIVMVLKNALLTFPYSGKISVRAVEIVGEIESLWGDISLAERRELVADLAMDLQRVSDLLLAITNRVEAKPLLEQNSLTRKLDTNRQRPENTLEFYRFVQGYFRARIRQPAP